MVLLCYMPIILPVLRSITRMKIHVDSQQKISPKNLERYIIWMTSIFTCLNMNSIDAPVD